MPGTTKNLFDEFQERGEYGHIKKEDKTALMSLFGQELGVELEKFYDSLPHVAFLSAAGDAFPRGYEKIQENSGFWVGKPGEINTRTIFGMCVHAAIPTATQTIEAKPGQVISYQGWVPSLDVGPFKTEVLDSKASDPALRHATKWNDILYAWSAGARNSEEGTRERGRKNTHTVYQLSLIKSS